MGGPNMTGVGVSMTNTYEITAMWRARNIILQTHTQQMNMINGHNEASEFMT